MLFDTHLHLNRREFAGEVPDVLARAAAAGVTRFLNVGYDLESSEASLALAAGDPRIWAAVGIHPHDARLLADPDGRLTAAGRAHLERLAELARHARVVALGEIGLDFFRDLSPRPAQRTALTVQLELADRLELPVIFHIRDAYAETVALVESMGVPRRGAVLHAFAGDAATVAWARERGLRLGIGGPVTYKNSRLPELLAACQPEDLLLETDAPWLPPVPHRGRRNEPAYLALVAARLAGIYGLSFAELARRTSRSAEQLFGLPASAGAA